MMESFTVMMKKVFLAAVVAAFCGATCVFSDDLSERMYTPLMADTGSCVRLLNEHGAIGCQSARDGTTGILYLIANEDHLAKFVDAPEDGYIALIAQSVFAVPANVEMLRSAGHFKGALLYDDEFQGDTSTYSPDSKQPNNENGLPYGSSGNTEVMWNKHGGGFNETSGYTQGLHWLDLDFPLYFLDNQFQAQVFQCYNEHNAIVDGKNPSFPQCAVDLDVWMYGSKDAATCLRRGYCDPLGGGSPYGVVRPTKKGDEYVMISAQMDTLAMFHDYAYGANADASGVVVALAAAEILGRANNSAVREFQRNIMFTLFNGESFGYIGSYRMAYDITWGQFPTVNTSMDSIMSITSYIELNQMSLGDSDEFTAFKYKKNDRTDATVQALQDAAASSPISFSEPANVDLPDASLRAILDELNDDSQRDLFGGIVLADHDQTGYKNRYFHSLYDDGKYIGISTNTSSDAVTRAAELAVVVAQAAWNLAGGNSTDIPDKAVNTDWVAHLFYCMTVDVNCTLAQKLQGSFGTAGKPMSRYVGVYGGSNTFKQDVLFLNKALGWALATDRNVAYDDDNPCTTTGNPEKDDFIELADKTCIKTTAFIEPAFSPAFKSYSELLPVGTAEKKYKDGRNPRYPSWTESVWGSISSRMFLVDSPKNENAILGGGIAMLFGGVGLVYVLNRQMIGENMETL